jgi:hypothetical protein
MNYLSKASQLSPANIVVLVAVFVALLYVIFLRLRKKPTSKKKIVPPGIPMFGSEEDESSRLAVEEGYRKVTRCLTMPFFRFVLISQAMHSFLIRRSTFVPSHSALQLCHRSISKR